MLTRENHQAHVETNDEPPPNRLYASRHAAAIRLNASRGMSRRMQEQIYGSVAVHQVLGPAT